MKARLRTPVLEIELEANTPKELFKQVADTQEVFAEKECGCCKKTNIRFAVRTVEGNDYFELQCTDCGARLSFGQSKQRPGQLFPIRKLTEQGKPSRKLGKYDTKCKGWTKYKGEPEPEKE